MVFILESPSITTSGILEANAKKAHIGNARPNKPSEPCSVKNAELS